MRLALSTAVLALMTLSNVGLFVLLTKQDQKLNFQAQTIDQLELEAQACNGSTRQIMDESEQANNDTKVCYEKIGQLLKILWGKRLER